MAELLPSTGFHYGVPFEQYAAWPAVNVHRLMPMDISPASCYYEMTAMPKVTDEMTVGSALHVASFEPARFDKEFYLGQKEYNATTREGKSIRAAEQEEAAGRHYIRRKAGEAVDCDAIVGMTKNLWAFKPARMFLEMPGQCEVCALWKDPQTGELCKARFDKLIPNSCRLGRQVVVELKSTGKGCGKTSAFGKQISKFKYHAQAMYYSWAVEVLTGEKPLHVFLVAENQPPYIPNWGSLDDEGRAVGETKYRAWLNKYHECSKAGRWPGYPETVNGSAPTFSLPHWDTYTEDL